MAQSICNIQRKGTENRIFSSCVAHIGQLFLFLFSKKLFLICEALGIRRTIEIYDQTEDNGPSVVLLCIYMPNGAGGGRIEQAAMANPVLHL